MQINEKPRKKTQAKNVIYETLPRVQENIFQIGVEWKKKTKKQQRAQPENVSGIISLLHMYRGQTIKNGVTLRSFSPSLFIIYLSHLSQSQGVVFFFEDDRSQVEGLFNNLRHETKSSFNAKYAEEIYYISFAYESDFSEGRIFEKAANRLSQWENNKLQATVDFINAVNWGEEIFGSFGGGD